MPSLTGVQTCALRSEEHTSELQSLTNIVCRLLLEKKNPTIKKLFCVPCILLFLIPFCSLIFRLFLSECFETIPHLLLQYFFNDTATTEIYTLSLHDALPICPGHDHDGRGCLRRAADGARLHPERSEEHTSELQSLAYLVCRLLLAKT